jgi:hypothetical protein
MFAEWVQQFLLREDIKGVVFRLLVGVARGHFDKGQTCYKGL